MEKGVTSSPSYSEDGYENRWKALMQNYKNKSYLFWNIRGYWRIMYIIGNVLIFLSYRCNGKLYEIDSSFKKTYSLNLNQSNFHIFNQ